MSLEEDILPVLINKKKIGQIYENSFSYDIGTKKIFLNQIKY